MRLALPSPAPASDLVSTLRRRAAWRAGFAQANLVILPADDALDFMRFCVRNPKPCPLLEVTDTGSPHPTTLAHDADLRTDLPRYRVFEDGSLSTSRPT